MMQPIKPFSEVLEAADKLSLDEQETLAEILHRRIVALRRAGLARDTREAQKEFQSGACRPASPDELMGEILS